MMMKWSCFAVLSCLALTSQVCAAPSTADRPIPNEYESMGGHSLGLNDSGYAALSGLPATRANPAMLSLERGYSVDGAYHWPSAGRNYYEAGVVDSKTSSVAAGFLYHGIMGDYDKDGTKGLKDSPLKRRAVLGISQTFNVVSLGIGGNYVEADPDAVFDDDAKKGFSLNLGVAGLLTPALRVAASVESLANEKIKQYAPRVIRLGTAWVLAENTLTLHADYRERERVSRFEGTWPDIALVGVAASEPSASEFSQPERMLMASFSAKFKDMLCLVGGYGHSLSDDRRSLAAGLALVNNNISFSYNAQRPNLALPSAHQSVNLSFKLTL